MKTRVLVLSMVLLPAGEYQTFTGETKKMNSFLLDRFPVTIADYLTFLQRNPEWRRSKAKSLFVDHQYLASWKNDLTPLAPGNVPVTQVTWFSANAFCNWKGKQLPTNDQWEYAAYDRGRNKSAIQQKIFNWYSRPNSTVPERIGRSAKNGFGISDLHGLIWEWTFDFNNTASDKLNCGSGSAGKGNPEDYATFMRYSLRNSLKANYTTANLGFRCAKEVKK